MKKPSPAYTLLQHVWTHSAYPSHRQKNASMSRALSLATESMMKFEPGDIRAIYAEFRAGYWMGEVEGRYAAAVECGNTSAAEAWETHFKRPAWLWPEKTAKAERLHVGSKITWRGLDLKVTSFAADGSSLIACGAAIEHKPEGYLNDQSYPLPARSVMQGRTVYCHEQRCYRRVLVSKDTPEGSSITVLGPKVETDSTPGRRVCIHFEEMEAEKKACAQRLRQTLAAIRGAADLTALNDLRKQLTGEHEAAPFRHFDLEKIHAAWKEKTAALEKAMTVEELERQLSQARAENLARFKAGDGPRLVPGLPKNYLRVKDGRVEVTNGNAVDLSEALAGFRFASKHRAKGWRAGGVYCGGHEMKEITPEGVVIGCTPLDWEEIETLKPHLK